MGSRLAGRPTFSLSDKKHNTGLEIEQELPELYQGSVLTFNFYCVIKTHSYQWQLYEETEPPFLFLLLFFWRRGLPIGWKVTEENRNQKPWADLAAHGFSISRPWEIHSTAFFLRGGFLC